MTRKPPSDAVAASPSWQAFDDWATKHHVPVDPAEDWEYLWECFLAGFAKGYVAAVKEPVDPLVATKLP